MDKKKILVLSLSPLHRDPRVLRQLNWLGDEFDVTAAGYTDPNLPRVTYYPIKMPARSFRKKIKGLYYRVTSQFDRWYWTSAHIKDTFNELKEHRFDTIVCNDLNTLPLGLALKQHSGGKVIFDAHEFYPGHFDNSLYWRLIAKKFKTYLCNRYIPQCDEFITVSPGLARGYKQLLNRDAMVITNAPDFSELKPQQINSAKIKLIHHGGAIRARNLDKMVKMSDYLDERFELYFMLVPTSKGYIEELQALANGKKVFFLPPVPTLELPKFLNQFDLGIYILPPQSFNMQFALPNKIFEFIQARLGVAIGPSPDMAEIVNKYQIGVVSPDFTEESLAKIINGLSSEQIMSYKRASDLAAKAEAGEKNRDIFLDLIDK